MTNVIYWELFENGKSERKSGACFSGLYGRYDDDLPPKIRYIAKVDDTLTDDEVAGYIAFLVAILPKKLFTWELNNHEAIAPAPGVMWELHTKGMKYKTALLYLTAFRYLDEFPAVIKHFLAQASKQGATSASERFRLFQESHYAAQRGEVDTNNMGGHGLICAYRSSSKPISLLRFRRNIKKAIGGVQEHFS